MQAKLKTKELSAALDRLKTVVPGRSTLPVLSNVLIEATLDGVQLTTTNLEQRLSMTLDADVADEGALTIPCDRFASTIAKLPDEFVELKSDEKNVMQIQAGKRKSKMAGTTEKEFPQDIELTEPVVKFSAPAKQLGAWLKLLAPFQSTEIQLSAKVIFCGVHLQEVGGQLFFHATDGKAMLRVKSGIDVSPLDCVIPSPGVRALTSVCKSGDVMLDIGVNAVRACGEDWTLISKLTEGKFSNIELILNQSCGEGAYKGTITAKRDDILNAMDYVDPFCGIAHFRRVTVKASGGKVVFSGSVAEVGESNAEIEGQGEDEFMINPDYFVNMVKSSTSDEIKICGGDNGNAPVIINDGTRTVVVVPLRVK